MANLIVESANKLREAPKAMLIEEAKNRETVRSHHQARARRRHGHEVIAGLRRELPGLQGNAGACLPLTLHGTEWLVRALNW
jgi:hypothetical protein